MDRARVLGWLSSMTDKQFVDFFYEAVAERDTSEIKGERGHLVIANTSKSPGEERDTVFLASPDKDEYESGWGDDCPICQTGHCGECGASVRSISKHAICPLCDTKVSCT